MNRVPKTLRYEEIKIGSVFQFERTLTAKDKALFIKLTSDESALTLYEINEKTRNRQNQEIVHGMLAASLFSTLIDCYCPGPKSLYLSQSAQFRKPLLYGEKIIVRGIVKEKSEGARVITIQTDILAQNRVIVSGEAKIKLLN